MPATTTPKGPPRASSSDVERRLAEVTAAIGKLWTTSRMMREFAARWGIGPQTVYVDYIAVARKRLREQYAAAAPFAADRIREGLADLYDQAMSVGDHRTAATVLKQLAVIDGAEAPTKVNVATSGVEIAIGPGNPDATRSRIEELLAKPGIRERLLKILTPSK